MKHADDNVLDVALARLRQLKFPRGGTDERIDDLHARLVDYDGYVNGIALQLAEGKHPMVKLRPNLSLRAELTAIRDNGTAAGEDAKRLLKYLDALDGVVAAVLAQT